MLQLAERPRHVGQALRHNRQSQSGNQWGRRLGHAESKLRVSECECVQSQKMSQEGAVLFIQINSVRSAESASGGQDIFGLPKASDTSRPAADLSGF